MIASGRLSGDLTDVIHGVFTRPGAIIIYTDLVALQTQYYKFRTLGCRAEIVNVQYRGTTILDETHQPDTINTAHGDAAGGKYHYARIVRGGSPVLH